MVTGLTKEQLVKGILDNVSSFHIELTDTV